MSRASDVVTPTGREGVQPCDHPSPVKIEAAYDGVADLRYSGLIINGVLVVAAAWCPACGAFALAAPNEPYAWRTPSP